MLVLLVMADAAVISWFDSEQITVEKSCHYIHRPSKIRRSAFSSQSMFDRMRMCDIVFDHMRRQRNLSPPAEDLLAEGQGFSRKIAGNTHARE